MPTNPERVARKLIDALCIPPRRHQLDLFCPDAVWLFPLAVEPAPRQLYGKPKSKQRWVRDGMRQMPLASIAAGSA